MSSVFHRLVSVLGERTGNFQISGIMGGPSKSVGTLRGGKHHWSVPVERTHFMDCHLLLRFDHETSPHHWVSKVQMHKQACTLIPSAFPWRPLISLLLNPQDQSRVLRTGLRIRGDMSNPRPLEEV